MYKLSILIDKILINFVRLFSVPDVISHVAIHSLQVFIISSSLILSVTQDVLISLCNSFGNDWYRS